MRIPESPELDSWNLEEGSVIVGMIKSVAPTGVFLFIKGKKRWTIRVTISDIQVAPGLHAKRKGTDRWNINSVGISDGSPISVRKESYFLRYGRHCVIEVSEIFHGKKRIDKTYSIYRVKSVSMFEWLPEMTQEEYRMINPLIRNRKRKPVIGQVLLKEIREKSSRDDR